MACACSTGWWRRSTRAELSDAAPCEVWFYHLERTRLEEALPELLEKTLQRGWKALVRTGDPGRIEHLDSWLWAYRDDSFLPHGRADEPGAARQPILLTTEAANANSAEALFLVDGAAAEGLTDYVRCMVVFDGADEAQLLNARNQWKAARALGLPAVYWKQKTDRGWEKQGG